MIRISAATASTVAVLAFAAPVQAAPARITIQVVEQQGSRVRVTTDNFTSSPTIVVAGQTPAPPALHEGDFGLLTDADMAMLQHALTAGAEETDFSAFYLDDE